MSEKAISIHYRPEVDGLRAIAILLVLLFHCGFRSFGGGFVGVDVFFVISGFLITSLILSDLRNGVFSFSRFYSRRIRRLLPALLVTVLLTLAGAILIMTPEHLADTAKAGAMAMASLSNFYFARLASYFDTSAQQKPFLHMWSLSVEEQFYLFWPATLFLLHRWKRSWVIPALVLGGIPVGLAISQYWIFRNPNHAYFLLPFRGFQFLMGASCIWLSRIEIRSKTFGHIIGLCGLLTILGSSLFFSDATPFPGLAAAVPSVGAMLVIWQGRQTVMQHLLGNRIMVWFGRISYSTYLVHWPITVFCLYLAFKPLSLIEKSVLFVVSVIAGQILDSTVTQRFRYTPAGQSRRWMFSATQMALVSVIGILCFTVIATGGLPRRFALVPEVARYRDESAFPFLHTYGDGVHHTGSGGSRRVLIFGDSMAQNYVPAILQMDGIRDAEIDLVTRGGCVLALNAVLVNYGSPDRDCLKLRDQLYQRSDRYDLVIWSQNWLGYGRSLYWSQPGGTQTPAFAGEVGLAGWREGVDATIDHFALRTRKMVVIGPPVTVEVNPIMLRIGPLTNISRITAQLDLLRETSRETREPMEEGLRTLVSSKPNTLYIDPRSFFCDDLQCRLSDGAYSFYLDSLHNTSAAIPTLRTGLERAGLRF